MGVSWVELLAGTFAGERGPARRLVKELHPVVVARVARVLGRARGRCAPEDLEDLTQEVFAFLFDERARALRAWDPERGLSLPNFVGLLAERTAITILRSVPRAEVVEDPLREGVIDRLDDPGVLPEPAAFSRELLHKLLDGVRVNVSALGLHLFELLYVEERPVDEVVASCKMSRDAVYAWRSRLRKLVARLAGELLAEDQPATTVKRGTSG